jgi:hypothetical protein
MRQKPEAREREGGDRRTRASLEERHGRESGRHGPVLITMRLQHGFVEDAGIHKFDSNVGVLGAVLLLVSH